MMNVIYVLGVMIIVLLINDVKNIFYRIKRKIELKNIDNFKKIFMQIFSTTEETETKLKELGDK